VRTKVGLKILQHNGLDANGFGQQNFESKLKTAKIFWRSNKNFRNAGFIQGRAETGSTEIVRPKDASSDYKYNILSYRFFFTIRALRQIWKLVLNIEPWTTTTMMHSHGRCLEWIDAITPSVGGACSRCDRARRRGAWLAPANGVAAGSPRRQWISPPTTVLSRWVFESH